MRTLLASAGLALLLALATEPSVSAQEAPAWMKQTLPDQALKPLQDEFLAVMNPSFEGFFIASLMSAFGAKRTSCGRATNVRF